MHDVILQSVWANLLVAVPFMGIVLLSVFRLDAIVAAPRHTPRLTRRPACGYDENGALLLTDPDGRPWTAPGENPARNS